RTTKRGKLINEAHLQPAHPDEHQGACVPRRTVAKRYFTTAAGACLPETLDIYWSSIAANYVSYLIKNLSEPLTARCYFAQRTGDAIARGVGRLHRHESRLRQQFEVFARVKLRRVRHPICVRRQRGASSLLGFVSQPGSGSVGGIHKYQPCGRRSVAATGRNVGKGRLTSRVNSNHQGPS